MFGLSKLFAAFSRLTTSVNTMADLFDSCNHELAQRLNLKEQPTLSAEEESCYNSESLPSPPVTRNGKTVKAK